MRVEGAVEVDTGLLLDRLHQPHIQVVGAGVVELAGDGAHHGQRVIVGIPQLVVALVLLLHIAHGIEGAALVELVDGHHIGEVEHVDLLQLRGCAELRRHDVERDIAVVQDLRIALADAARLQDDQVEACCLQHVHGLLHMLAQREVALARGEAAHVDAFAADAVHADAVAQQRAAGLALARVHTDDADGLGGLIEDKATDQFIHHG